MSRAVAYLRVSTDEQAETGHSLPDQEQAIRTYLLQAGHHCVEVVSDDFTGRLIQRPGVARIRELAEAQTIDLVVCAKLDRLARANYLGTQFVRWLESRRVRVEFVQCRFEDNAVGRFQRGVMWEVAELEAEMIRERTSAGRDEKARQGAYPSGLKIYGYRQISRAQAAVIPECAGRGGELVPVPEQAEIIQSLYQRYADGESMISLAADLTRRGIPTPRGCRGWLPFTIGRIIANPTYMGRRFWGTKRHERSEELTRGGNPRKTVRDRPEAEWIEIPVPPLVDVALWEAANQRLQDNLNAYRGRPTRLWLLSGIVFCGACKTQKGTGLRCGGGRTSNSKSRPGYEYRFYRCPTRNMPGRLVLQGGWCGVQYDATKLEAMVLRELLRLIDPAPGGGTRFGRLAREEAEARQRETAGAAVSKEEALRQLRTVDAEERALLEASLAGFSARLVQDKLRGLHARRADLSLRLRQAEAQLAAADDPARAEREAEGIALEVRRRLETSDTQDRADVLKAIYRALFRVTLRKGKPPEIAVRTHGVSLPR